MEANDKPVLIYATFPSLTEAEVAGRRIVEDRLAACINILPGMTSIYRWQGTVEQASEVVMIAKTRASLASAAMAAIRQLHPYDTPALLVLDVADGDPRYVGWLMAETDAGPGPAATR